MDQPWNPARLEQRIARAWRKHQTRPVTVINFVSEYTIEHRMLGLLDQKRTLAEGVLDQRGDLSETPLPTGRAAFMERLDAVLGARADAAAAAAAESAAEGPARAPAAEAARLAVAALATMRAKPEPDDAESAAEFLLEEEPDGIPGGPPHDAIRALSGEEPADGEVAGVEEFVSRIAWMVADRPTPLPHR